MKNIHCIIKDIRICKMLKMRGFSVKGINKNPLNLLKLSEILYFGGLKACSGGVFYDKTFRI